MKNNNTDNIVPPITRHGNELAPYAKFLKPKKEKYTAILEFEVINPQEEMETLGERLRLTPFGEYCPDASLRGYQLEELLSKPENYRPRIIVQVGKVILLNYTPHTRKARRGVGKRPVRSGDSK